MAALCRNYHDGPTFLEVTNNLDVFEINLFAENLRSHNQLRRWETLLTMARCFRLVPLWIRNPIESGIRLPLNYRHYRVERISEATSECA